MTSSQLGVLSTSQLGYLTSVDLVALSPSSINGFTDNQLASLNSAQLGAFTTQQISYLKTLTPLVLDLSGVDALTTANVAGLSAQAFNVLTSTSPTSQIQTEQIGQSGVQFDLGNTGQVASVGWITPGEGFLVDVPSTATTISNGSELFGNATVLPDGQTASNGFAALSAFAQSGATQITSSDPLFNELKVWVDTGNVGSTPSGELFSLQDLNIQSINLNDQEVNIANNGNTIGLMSSFTTTDGSVHQIADVWFASAAGTQNTTAQLTAALNNYTSSANSLSLTGSSISNSPTQSGSGGTGSISSVTNQLAQALSNALSTSQSNASYGTNAQNSTAMALGAVGPSGLTTLASQNNVLSEPSAISANGSKQNS
jgi:hypothetical protein